MSEIGTYHNKQSILGRMLELAAAIQGVHKSELLDPVVILLIESLAEEIYLLSAEIDNLEARVLNKLSSMLVSESGTIANPAHSLLHVSPREHTLELTVTDSFTLDEPEKAQDNLNLSLYPVCNTPVYRGGIRYFIFERYLYSMDRELTKTLITRGGTLRKEEHEVNSFWIGLELDDTITDIENLSFYIHLSRGYHAADGLYQLLHGKWKCCGENISIRKGLFSVEEEAESPKPDLFRKYDNSCMMNRVIRKQYDRHYMTIGQPLDITDRKERFPALLTPYFSEEIRSGFTKEMLWFEITCPPDFTEDQIRAIEISINIVPVSCKQLVREVLQVNKQIPVIPLHTQDNESFLSVHSLSDSDGVRYYDIPPGGQAEESHGVYSLRSSGYERFGTNDAKEFLSNMASLLDREAASFFKRSSESKSAQTALQENMNGMIRNLSGIVHSEKKHPEIKNYLLVEQQRQTEIYFLKYWTANSLAGETIREHTPVRASSGLPVNPAGIHLIRPLSGGKRTPPQYEKYNLYKKSLTEHPLLVSPDDIRKFCLKEFGDLVERAEVGSGYKKSTVSGSDFIKTTDVYLYIRKYRQDKVDQGTGPYIEQALRERSPVTSNYRVILK